VRFRAPTTDGFGIASHYQDAFGKRHRVSSATRSAIRAAMRSTDRPRAGLETKLRFLKPGEPFSFAEPFELTLEDGTLLKPARGPLCDLPIGYHSMRNLEDGRQTKLFVRPETCYLPESTASWGWAVQLYALRSKRSWGMGDLRDLRQFGRWSAGLGGQFTLSSPLGAATPILPQQPSPYFPSSRRFWSPLYLCVEEIEGAAEAKIPLAKIAEAGRKLNEHRLIDRDAIFRLKRDALESLWRRFRPDPAFDAFCDRQGTALGGFATFCALAEHFQSGWKQWPPPFRRPESLAVRDFARHHHRRIKFHQWLQWCLTRQLERAAKALPVMQDLPIGVDPDGADAWVWQDLLATDVSIGAPPDAFNSQGQRWGLPPFIPHRLRESGYEPFRETIRAAMALQGGLRIDHVMGLFRLFWIPDGASPAQGAFVYYPCDELLSVLAIESHRAKGWVVGEDLGTVEPGVRHELWRRNILSYRLLWFQTQPVHTFPKRSLAAVTTHDLFTVAGLWNGSDLRAQRKAGLNANISGSQRILARLRRRLNLKSGAKPADAIAKTYELLNTAPSRLLTATLDDALAVEERPNMPGTTTAWPNWSLALPASLEQIQKSELAHRIARACKKRRRARGSS
jgi:4-alpha-glucanotransferase